MGFFKNRRQVLRRGSRLALSLTLLAACIQPILAQSKLRLSRSSADVDGLRTFCEINVGWSYGRLLGYDYNRSAQPVICVHDWNGKGERVPFGIPGASRIRLAWAAMAPDGGFALIGTAYMEDGAAGTFVARVSSDRKQQVVTRVWPYCPERIVIAPDGVLWTLGWVLNEAGYRSESNVLRRFDGSGKVLSSAAIRAEGAFTPDDAVQVSSLCATPNRIGWLTNANEYIEFALDGREILRINGPKHESERRTAARSLALSPDGVVLVSTGMQSHVAVATLDRRTGAWIKLDPPTPGPTLGSVMGFEDGDIVIDLGRQMLHRLKPELQ